jgi:hypothetical protein
MYRHWSSDRGVELEFRLCARIRFLKKILLDSSWPVRTVDGSFMTEHARAQFREEENTRTARAFFAAASAEQTDWMLTVFRPVSPKRTIGTFTLKFRV